jgi:hypothetical protein
MSWRYVMYAAAFLAPLLCTKTSRGQESFEELLRRVPGEANALIMVNAAKARTSEFIRREGRIIEEAEAGMDHHVFAASEVELLVRAANIDMGTLEPVWELSLATLNAEPKLAVIARVTGGRTDSLGGVPAVWLPIDGYLMQFGPRLVGMIYPGDRQNAARWAQDAQSSPQSRLSPYLAQAAKYPEAVGTELIMAMDLRYVVSPERVRENLAKSEVLKGKQADAFALSEVLASVQGVTLGVRVVDQIVGSLRIDFERDATALAPFAKELVLEKLGELGAMIDEMQAWEASVQGRTVFLKGGLTKSGLRRILSLVEPPAPPLSEPKSASESPSQTDPKAQATLNHFQAVQSLVTDLKRPSGMKTTGQYALWVDRYARKLDQLPILGVDKDMVEFTGWAASVLRSIASGYRRVGMEAGKYSNNPSVRAVEPYTGVTGGYYRRGYWGGSGGWRTGTQWNYAPGPAPSVIANRIGRINAAASKMEVLEQLDNALSEMRRVMTERYQIEF